MSLALYCQAGTIPLAGGRFALFCYGWEKYVHSILSITCPDIPSENISIDGNWAYVTFPALTGQNSKFYQFTVKAINSDSSTSTDTVYEYQGSDSSYVSYVSMASDTEVDMRIMNNNVIQDSSKLSAYIGLIETNGSGEKIVTFEDIQPTSFLENGTNDKLTYTLPATSTAKSYLIVNRYNIAGSSYDTLGSVVVNQPPQSIIVENEEVTVTGESGTITQNITTNNMDDSTLSVSSNAAWAVPTLNNKVLSIAYEANNGATNRTATITITGTSTGGGTRTATITLTQNLIGIITPEDSNVELTYKAQTVTQNITTVNMDDSTLTARSNASWATVSLDNKVLSITCTSTWAEISPRSTTIVITGTDLAGNTVTSTISLRQKVQSGRIYLDRDSITVPADHRYRHRDVNVSTNMVTNSVPAISEFTPSITGDVTGTFSWYTYEDENEHSHSYLVFTPDDNETENTLTGTITVSGVDRNGDTITNSYTVTQRPYNSDIYFDPSYNYWNDGNKLDIPYNVNSTTFNATCNAGIVSIDSVYTPTPYPYELANENPFYNYYQSGTVTKLDDSHYVVVVNTTSNATRTPSKVGFIRVTATTEFGYNPWLDGNLIGGDAGCAVRKCGIPGSITLTPSTKTVNGEAGSTTFSYSADSYMTQPISVTHTGNMNITNFTISGSTVVVEYGENRGRTVLTETITATGTDYQGLTITKTVTLNQEPLSVLEFIETEKTIDRETNTVYFRISDINVTNLSISQSGDTSIISSATLTATEEGHLLTVVTNDNPARAIKTVTFTVRGNGTNGVLSTSAVLHKTGADGLLEIIPTSMTLLKNGLTIEMTTPSFTVNSDGMRSYGVSIDGGWLTVSIDNDVISITASVNNTGESRVCYVSPGGYDYKGKWITCVAEVTQLPYNSLLELSPESITLDYEENTATFTADIINVDNVTITTSGNDDFITNTSISNGSLIVTTEDFSTRELKTATITVSGTGLEGDLTDSVTLNKYGPDGIITVDNEIVEIPKTGSSFTVNVTRDGIEDISATSSGDINFTSLSFNNDKTVLTVNFGTNSTDNDLTSTITITGTDYKGNTITQTVSVTQIPYDFWVTPKSQIVQYEQSSATITINAVDATFTTVEFSGYTSLVEGYSRNGNTITIDLETVTVTTEEIVYVTVNGVTSQGRNVSDTATLRIWGPDGYIIANTSGTRGMYGEMKLKRSARDPGNEAHITYSPFGVTVNSVASDSDWFRVLRYPLLPADTGFRVYVDWDAYSGPVTSWDSNRVAHLTVSGVDYKGNPVTFVSTITQYATDPEVSVSPRDQEIEWNGYAEFEVTIIGPVIQPMLLYPAGSRYAYEPASYTWLGEWGTGVVRTNTARLVPPANNSTAKVCSDISFNGTTLLSTYNGDIEELRYPTVLQESYPPGLIEWDYVTDRVHFCQKAKPATITLTPSTTTVNKDAGSVTFAVTVDGVSQSSLTRNWTGAMITSASFNSDKTRLTVTYSANPNIASRTAEICVSDSSGNVTGCATITQTGEDPEINVENLYIRYNEDMVTHFIGTKGIEDLSIQINGDVTITDYTLTPTTDGYNLIVETPDNNTTQIYRSTATLTGTVSEGQYEGETRTATFEIVKYGIAGVIEINPTSKTVYKAGETVVFTVILENMDNSSVTASVGTFNADKSQLTVVVGENTSTTTRTINVVVSGTDLNNNTQSATAVITQYGIDPYISISPESQTLSANESTATYSVTAYLVSDLSVTLEGAIDILSYSLENGVLTIETADNTELLSLMETITITGTTENGDIVSGTATLVKFGTGGGVVINPVYTIGGNAGLLAVPYNSERIREDTVYAYINGDIDVTNIAVNRDGKFIYIEYNANSGSENKVSTLTLSCYDEDDVPRYATSTITQLTSSYSFSLNPTRRTVEYTGGTVTHSVTSSNVNSIELFESYGNMDATYSYSGGSVSISIGTNSDSEKKYGVVTLTGISSSGNTVTTSAYIIQNNEYYNDFRFELVDSTQENVTVDGGGKKLYYDILSVNKSYGTYIPYYVSGFILTGYWGSLPTVKYRDGFPYVIMPINTKEATRDAVVTFLQEQSYLELSAHIHQEEGAEPDVHPIWEIVELTAPNESFAEYHITTDGDIIYAGKAYRYPEEYKTVWTVNDTVSNYLGNGIYFSEGLQQIPNYSKDFFIGTNTNAKYVKTFYNSWAYEHTNYWLSDPIDKRVDPRQWLPVSFISTEYPSIDVAGRNYVTLMENSGWTVMTNLRNYALNCNSGVNAIGRNNEIINYKVDKGDYVLYYSNAYGGWDALLVSGTVRQSDNIEHLTYKRHSASQTKFSKINYQNNITPTWTLKTGITVDGNKMYHLLESTMVYLHNLTTNKIVPVIVTNSQCEYMTYRNNGKRPYFYNITVEASNTKLRK